MSERVMDFLSEGMVGFAALAIGLIVVLPMLPLIAVGYGFSKLLAQWDGNPKGENGEAG